MAGMVIFCRSVLWLLLLLFPKERDHSGVLSIDGRTIKMDLMKEDVRLWTGLI
jgi:hypothetical protein